MSKFDPTSLPNYSIGTVPLNTAGYSISASRKYKDVSNMVLFCSKYSIVDAKPTDPERVTAVEATDRNGSKVLVTLDTYIEDIVNAKISEYMAFKRGF